MPLRMSQSAGALAWSHCCFCVCQLLNVSEMLKIDFVLSEIATQRTHIEVLFGTILHCNRFCMTSACGTFEGMQVFPHLLCFLLPEMKDPMLWLEKSTSQSWRASHKLLITLFCYILTKWKEIEHVESLDPTFGSIVDYNVCTRGVECPHCHLALNALTATLITLLWAESAFVNISRNL